MCGLKLDLKEDLDYGQMPSPGLGLGPLSACFVPTLMAVVGRRTLDVDLRLDGEGPGQAWLCTVTLHL